MSRLIFLAILVPLFVHAETTNLDADDFAAVEAAIGTTPIYAFEAKAFGVRSAGWGRNGYLALSEFGVHFVQGRGDGQEFFLPYPDIVEATMSYGTDQMILLVVLVREGPRYLWLPTEQAVDMLLAIRSRIPN